MLYHITMFYYAMLCYVVLCCYVVLFYVVLMLCYVLYTPGFSSFWICPADRKRIFQNLFSPLRSGRNGRPGYICIVLRYVTFCCVYIIWGSLFNWGTTAGGHRAQKNRAFGHKSAFLLNKCLFVLWKILDLDAKSWIWMSTSRIWMSKSHKYTHMHLKTHANTLTSSKIPLIH